MRVIFLASLMCLAVHAQESVLRERNFSLRLAQSSNHQTLTLTGNFALGDFRRAQPLLAQLNRSKPILVVNMNFGGGLAAPIQSFKRHIERFCRDHGCRIVTVVKRSAECTSFCMPIYMTGEARATITGARFGFHTSRFGVLGLNIESDGYMLDEYEKSGVSRVWLEAHRHYFDSLDVTYVTPPRLAGSDIVTHQFATEAEFQEFLGQL